MALELYARESEVLVLPGELEPLPAPPAQQLESPMEWLILGTDGGTGNPTVWATAVAVVQGWLLLWLGEVPVAVVQPGHWTGATARVRRNLEHLF